MAKELKKFNIKVSKDQVSRDGSNGGRQLIVDVLEQLREYDVGLDGG